MTSWLERNGVPTSSISRTLAGSWLTVADVPVSQANELLGASYQLYYHAGRNDTILRTAGYALPGALHVHVKTVVPTTAFTSTRFLQQTLGRRSGEAAAPNVTSNVTSWEPMNMLSRRQPIEQKEVDPSILRSMYRTATYVPNPFLTGNKLGIVGYSDEYPDLDDLDSFMSRFRSDGVKQIVKSYTIDENAPNGYESGWANLFTQYAAAMAWPTPIIFYRGTGPREFTKKRPRGGGDDAVLQFLKYADGREDIPRTIGFVTDGTKEKIITDDYADSVCKQFEVLGARGVTVLVSTGDYGVGYGNCREFTPKFPASCTCVF